ncbi:MAG: hypothetical protein ACPG80_03750, partial [Rickettsiales bacterium]
MPRGLLYSAFLHLAILVLAIFGLPEFFNPKKLEEPQAITVEILPVGSQSNVPNRIKTKPKPKPTKPKPQPTPAKPVKKPAPPIKKEEPAPAPEPVVKPEPPKEKKKKPDTFQKQSANVLRKTLKPNLKPFKKIRKFVFLVLLELKVKRLR